MSDTLKLLYDRLYTALPMSEAEQEIETCHRQLIEWVNIERNFEVEVEFKISVTQFFDFLYPEGDKSVYYRAS